MNESNNNSRCESDKRQELSDDEAGALGEPPHDRYVCINTLVHNGNYVYIKDI